MPRDTTVIAFRQREATGARDLILLGCMAWLRPSSHLYGARFSLLQLRQRECKDAILQFSCNLALIDLARKLKASGVMSDVVFDIERLKPLVFGKVELADDAQDAVLHANIDSSCLDAMAMLLCLAVTASDQLIRMVLGLSRSDLGSDRAKTPSRYSALMPSGSSCTGIDSVRSKSPETRSRRCTLASG